MSADNAAPAEPGAQGQDQMADEWAAAMAEAKGAEGGALATSESPAQFASFGSGGGAAAAGAGNDLNMILDIPVQLTVELGRIKIPIKHILQLAQGSVVELETLAGEPMDVLVNGYLIAQGEVVVVNDKFGIRLTDIVTPSERMRRLSK
jgi:flagellar motor switch protein FliN